MIKRLFDICHAGIRTMFMWVCYRKTTLRIVSWSVLTTRLRIWYSYKRENEKHSSNKHTFCLLCMICVLLYTGHDVLWTYTCIYSYVGDCDKKNVCSFTLNTFDWIFPVASIRGKSSLIKQNNGVRCLLVCVYSEICCCASIDAMPYWRAGASKKLYRKLNRTLIWTTTTTQYVWKVFRNSFVAEIGNISTASFCSKNEWPSHLRWFTVFLVQFHNSLK